jgi:two-component system, OmpR family, KDP operon response regulator KdpE
MSLSILIADDARGVAEGVAFGVRMVWPDCEVSLATTGEEALRAFAAEAPDLVVLDVAMPPPDGLEVCRRIRKTSRVPILMLTVRDTTLDKVRALDLGADDYVTKPFDPMELLARLRALVRRGGGPLAQQEPVFSSGDFFFDGRAREVRIGDGVVRLTSTEFRLLEELIRHAGDVVPHQALLERVWGPDWTTDPNYLKVFIRRLRQKLGDDAERPRYILTEWGVGYRFLRPE